MGTVCILNDSTALLHDEIAPVARAAPDKDGRALFQRGGDFVFEVLWAYACWVALRSHEVV